MARLMLSVAVLLACVLATMAQVPIPTTPPGLAFGATDAPAVVLEFFIDLFCPDCKAAWPAVLDVFNHYTPTGLFQLRLHPFPLPYHHNAYYAAWASMGVHRSNATAYMPFASTMFTVQDAFFNSPTDTMTPQVVRKKIAAAATSAGIDADVIMTAFNDNDLESAVRVAWKYGCTRTVAGTPTFLVNGVLVQAQQAWTLQDWQTVLDPLFPPHALAAMPAPAACPSGTKSCQYLPGQTECCVPGEMCIPNVGCRC
eukprot:CAMPEP_0177650124 /NCGR_PEP_ID=MMETSP0447-20121125/11761_1 /TAXON_ID=0 /ORGANISM="Stygamoeba regulata, Strain BSH-02190019" /LENGTH=254 /DNA_ID=CAMNT_0019152945 /DNA_START=89 /DNA_END=853 /DNA_ORIENTATION=-